MTRLQRLEDTFLFLVLLFLPTQLGKHFWPNFSYIYSLKIDYLSPTIYFWDILVVGLLIVWILQRPKINKQALNLLLLFLLTQVLSLVKAANTGAGLVRIEQYLLAGLFGVYLASSNLEALFKKMPLPLGLAIIAESALAILQFIKGSTLGFWILGERNFNITTPGIAKFDFYGVQTLRPYATFPHPNVLAGFLLVGLAILSQVLKVKSKIVTLPLVLGGIAIFLTVSRAVILTGIITLALTVKRKWFLWVMIILVISSPILFTRFSSLLNFDNLAVIRREQLSEKAWQIFLKQPIFGVGLNNFIPQIAGNLVVGPSRFLQPVHNIILLSLAETGLVGLVGWIILIGYPRRKIFNLLPWLIILTLGMFDHYFLTLPQGYRLLFLVWGLSFLHVRIT